jgi:hypothetical protein
MYGRTRVPRYLATRSTNTPEWQVISRQICYKSSGVFLNQIHPRGRVPRLNLVNFVLQLYCILGYEKIMDVQSLSFRWIKPFWYFCLKTRYKASLALPGYIAFASRSIKTGLFFESLEFERPRGRVNCQTREGAPRTRVMHGENLRKFTETRARLSRTCCSLIYSRPSIQYI